MKRSPIARKTPIKRSPIKQQAANRKKSRFDFSADVKDRARRGASHWCEAKLPGCSGGVQHFHHRLLRSHGGPGTLENCAALCGRCHSWIHANPDWAYRHGWMVRSLNDPADVGVFKGCGPDCATIHCQ